MVKFMICKVETRNVRTFHFRCGFLEGMWYMYTVNLQYTSRIFYLDQTYVYTYVFACIFCIPEENYRRIPSIYVLGRIKFLKHSQLVMCRARAQDRPPARPKVILLGSSPPEARKPEARTSLIKIPKSLGFCMYINTRPTARPQQILTYPNPPEARNLKKRQARARPKPENLRLAHH